MLEDDDNVERRVGLRRGMAVASENEAAAGESV
jgi:hypothetical protein